MGIVCILSISLEHSDNTIMFVSFACIDYNFTFGSTFLYILADAVYSFVGFVWKSKMSFVYFERAVLCVSISMTPDRESIHSMLKCKEETNHFVIPLLYAYQSVGKLNY